ncbi:MAG: hypothetical protein QOF66_321 [Mycobacterium sp.]|jgi:hypothetical protein|nr:hypothetical protein [Mycobacterium sp.]
MTDLGTEAIRGEVRRLAPLLLDMPRKQLVDAGNCRISLRHRGVAGYLDTLRRSVGL